MNDMNDMGTFESHRREVVNLIRRAFNMGADARINGVPWLRNPFRHSQCVQYRSWDKGWKHVHDHWGSAAKGPFLRLKDVAA